ncbi:MAG: HAD family hydrolase [Lentisphaerae bacterium]|nr:HAD family hydrolase [Lentisphaerota bacterium]MCP4100634.1 HAD family hydrolase [Lentisphaerota bacterium]
MDKICLNSIRHLFESQKRIEPIPTGLNANLGKNNNIKCVIFDIYGTLLVSTSGDIDKARFAPSYVLEAFSKCGVRLATSTPVKTASLILDEYEKTIFKMREDMEDEKIPHPEIDIRMVWQKLLKQLYEAKLIEKPTLDDVSRLAIYFETLSNPVYPMPSMHEIVHAIYKRGIPMGIISNAQFYTPVIMNFFLTGIINDFEDVEYFDRYLSIYSYKEKRGKPDISLYRKAASRCYKHYQVSPEQILYVGNDMLKDIYPAHSMGMTTALFAGDCRSLRMREQLPELKSIKPDYLINSLDQILEIIQ